MEGENAGKLLRYCKLSTRSGSWELACPSPESAQGIPWRIVPAAASMVALVARVSVAQQADRVLPCQESRSFSICLL